MSGNADPADHLVALYGLSRSNADAIMVGANAVATTTAEAVITVLEIMTAERDRLRAALEAIASPEARSNDGCQACPAEAFGRIARLALDGHLVLDGSEVVGDG